MTDQEMIKRVANKLRVESGLTINIELFWLNLATLAIQAMLEPTSEQLNAAREWSLEKYGKPIGNEAAIGCWKAMIEVIIK